MMGEVDLNAQPGLRNSARSVTTDRKEVSPFMVTAFTVEDTGRLGSGTVCLLKELASEQQEDSSAEYRRLVTELQHIVLGNEVRILLTLLFPVAFSTAIIQFQFPPSASGNVHLCCCCSKREFN